MVAERGADVAGRITDLFFGIFWSGAGCYAMVGSSAHLFSGIFGSAVTKMWPLGSPISLPRQ